MKSLITFGMCFTLLGFSANALAESGVRRSSPSSGGGIGSGASLPRMYLGALGGFASPPSTVGATTRVDYGGTMALRLYNGIAIGAYYFHTAKDERTGYGAPFNLTAIKIDAYGTELDYFVSVEKFLALRLGARLGPSKITINSLGINSSTSTPLAYGPVGSFDIFLHREVSLGAEATILFFGDSIKDPTFITYYLNGALKIWF